jgi:antitoxin MazE
MGVKVAKWGNSLGVRIPKDVVESLGLKEGDEMEIFASENGLLAMSRRLTREEAIEKLRGFRGRLPADYKFDREEANAR